MEVSTGVVDGDVRRARKAVRTFSDPIGSGRVSVDGRIPEGSVLQPHPPKVRGWRCATHSVVHNANMHLRHWPARCILRNEHPTSMQARRNGSLDQALPTVQQRRHSPPHVRSSRDDRSADICHIRAQRNSFPGGQSGRGGARQSATVVHLPDIRSGRNIPNQSISGDSMLDARSTSSEESLSSDDETFSSTIQNGVKLSGNPASHNLEFLSQEERIALVVGDIPDREFGVAGVGQKQRSSVLEDSDMDTLPQKEESLSLHELFVATNLTEPDTEHVVIEPDTEHVAIPPGIMLYRKRRFSRAVWKLQTNISDAFEDLRDLRRPLPTALAWLADLQTSPQFKPPQFKSSVS